MWIKTGIVLTILIVFTFHYHKKTELYNILSCFFNTKVYINPIQKKVIVSEYGLEDLNLSKITRRVHSKNVNFLISGDLCTPVSVIASKESEREIINNKQYYNTVCSLDKNNFTDNKQVKVIYKDVYCVFDVDTSNYVYYIIFFPYDSTFQVTYSKDYIMRGE